MFYLETNADVLLFFSRPYLCFWYFCLVFFVLTLDNIFFYSEKVIKTATLREHPYSSHISRFAVFPSFLSPDDPDRGVRAASQSFLNSLIPNKAPDVTLLSKTIGEIFLLKNSYIHGQICDNA